jgi:hypothetical protein
MQHHALANLSCYETRQFVYLVGQTLSESYRVLKFDRSADRSDLLCVEDPYDYSLAEIHALLRRLNEGNTVRTTATMYIGTTQTDPRLIYLPASLALQAMPGRAAAAASSPTVPPFWVVSAGLQGTTSSS